MNKNNQKPTDMLNNQDVTVYFIYQNIKILKNTKFSTSHSRSHFQSIRSNNLRFIYFILRLYNTLKMASGM